MNRFDHFTHRQAIIMLELMYSRLKEAVDTADEKAKAAFEETRDSFPHSTISELAYKGSYLESTIVFTLEMLEAEGKELKEELPL
jgi:hypothetical protein